jgi:hypothetical protein
LRILEHFFCDYDGTNGFSAATVLFFAVDFRLRRCGQLQFIELDIAFIRRFHLNLSLQLIPLSLAIFAFVVVAKIRWRSVDSS